MKTRILATKTAAVVSSLMLVVAPFAVSAESNVSNFLQGNVSQSPSGTITINSVTLVKNSGTADGTFENGWKYVLDISAPLGEQNLMMKFENWLIQNGSNIIPVAGNVRFYSAQSSNANNTASAIYINAANTYSATMFLIGNLDTTSTTMRRVQVTVESRIPNGTTAGSYSTNFGIRTQ